MANITITNNDSKGLIIWEPIFDDETISAAGAQTWPAGTVLGRITASGKLTVYNSGASDGSEVPKAVLVEEEVFSGAGDKSRRVLIGGRLRRDLVTAYNGGTPAALTIAEVDALRSYGIIAQVVTQRAELDNQ